ncbi:putative glycoside hydrolase [Sphaerisporangium sp. NBC_01403]|uniref:putative glycoside hydrolase n=1 Tax=Sphaerisporangium sp. NBC_01403 TaxID=2903599 RepID=UPI0032510F54
MDGLLQRLSARVLSWRRPWSPENWGGTEIGVDGTAAHAEISVVPSDVNVQADGLKATWNGGPAQIYMQDPAGGSDLRGSERRQGSRRP